MSSDFALEANSVLEGAIKALDQRRKLQHYKAQSENNELTPLVKITNQSNSDDYYGFKSINNNGNNHYMIDYDYHVNEQNKNLYDYQRNQNKNKHKESMAFEHLLHKVNLLGHDLREVQSSVDKIKIAQKSTLAKLHNEPSLTSSLCKIKEYCTGQVVTLEKELMTLSSEWNDRFEYAHAQRKQTHALLQRQMDELSVKTKTMSQEQCENKDWVEHKLRSIDNLLQSYKTEVAQMKITLTQEAERSSIAVQQQVKDVLQQVNVFERNQQNELSAVQRQVESRFTELADRVKKSNEEYIQSYLNTHRKDFSVNNNNNSSNSNSNSNEQESEMNELRAVRRQIQLLKEVNATEMRELQESVYTHNREQAKTSKLIQECKLKTMAHDERVESLEELIHTEINRINSLQRKYDTNNEQTEHVTERVNELDSNLHNVTTTLTRVQGTVEHHATQVEDAMRSIEKLNANYDLLLQRSVANANNNNNDNKNNDERINNIKNEIICDTNKCVKERLRSDRADLVAEMQETIQSSCNAIREEWTKQLNKEVHTINTSLQEEIETVNNNMGSELNKLKRGELAVLHQKVEQCGQECLTQHKLLLERKLEQLEHKMTVELESVNTLANSKWRTVETRLQTKLNETQENLHIEQEQVRAELVKMQNALEKCIAEYKKSNTHANNEHITVELIEEISNNVIIDKLRSMQNKFEQSLQGLKNDDIANIEYNVSCNQVKINDMANKIRTLEQEKVKTQDTLEKINMEIDHVKKNNNNENGNVAGGLHGSSMSKEFYEIEKRVSSLSNHLSEFITSTNNKREELDKNMEHFFTELHKLQSEMSVMKADLLTYNEKQFSLTNAITQRQQQWEQMKSSIVSELKEYLDKKWSTVTKTSQTSEELANVTSTLLDKHEILEHKLQLAQGKSQNVVHANVSNSGNKEIVNSKKERNKEYKTLKLLHESMELLSNEMESNHDSSYVDERSNDSDSSNISHQENVTANNKNAKLTTKRMDEIRKMQSKITDSNNNSSNSDVSTIDVNGAADKFMSVSSSIPVMMFNNNAEPKVNVELHKVDIAIPETNNKSNAEIFDTNNSNNNNISNGSSSKEVHKAESNVLGKTSSTPHTHIAPEITLSAISNNNNNNNNTALLRSLIISPPKSDSSQSNDSFATHSHSREESKHITDKENKFLEQEEEQEESQEIENVNRKAVGIDKSQEQTEKVIKEECQEKENLASTPPQPQTQQQTSAVVINNYDDWDDWDNDDHDDDDNIDETDKDDTNEKDRLTNVNIVVDDSNIEATPEKNECILEAEHELEQKETAKAAGDDAELEEEEEYEEEEEEEWEEEEEEKEEEKEEEEEEEEKEEEESSSSSLELPFGTGNKEERLNNNDVESLSKNVESVSAVATAAVTTVKRYTDFDDSSTESENEQ